jgi:8-oxo-dGTP pyrophosphatase MutT (NUDIX family)
MVAGKLEFPGAAVVPVPAATVVLVRDGAHGPETWMMRRVKGMAFAPGAAVFPGGRVDPRDADVSIRWLGPEPEQFAARMQIDAAAARELVTAALRELFEETGLLLASPPPAEGLDAARRAIESRDLPMAQFLADHGCALNADALHPWARWVTPPVEKRRYDTWFFVSALPAGAEARAVSSEADQAGWMAVDEVLRAYAAGQMHVLPPTVTMLRGLAAAGTVAGILATVPHRSLAPVHPQVTLLPDGSVHLVADGTEFVFPPAAAPASRPE